MIVASPGPSGLTLASFQPDVFTQGTLGIAVLFALTGFIGFEATAVFRDEARDPERTIPRATYAAVLIIGGFYALTVLGVRRRDRTRPGHRGRAAHPGR